MKTIGNLVVDRIELVTAGPEAAETGLIGFITCRLNHALQLDGLALRKTQDGRHVLSFPARRDHAGRQRFYVRPLDDETREAIESQVLSALGIPAA
jgi:DNA-binding cell septation regulator SpoVG